MNGWQVSGALAMARKSSLYLPIKSWPAEDQWRWQAAFRVGDRFDGGGPGSHLAHATRQNLTEGYGRFLRFIATNRSELLDLMPDQRVDRRTVADYVEWRRRSRGDPTIAVDLSCLRGALRLLCPGVDWSWLLSLTKRIAAAAPRKPKKHHLVTSERLYALGMDLMERAGADAEAAKRISKAHALQYRDGLVIALAALIPMRRRTLVALCIGKHLVKNGDLWELVIPAEDTKTRRPLDYPISMELCARIDLYLERFRSRLPGAHTHMGLWASNKQRPISPVAICAAVRRRTKKAFGFTVSLHRFRHAAATFWSIHDPVNVRGVKDLLGHASFGMTERHYVMAQSRLAGRTLAQIVDAARK
jgi:integrase/recombinase XerD